jgi:hypothetical protein
MFKLKAEKRLTDTELVLLWQLYYNYSNDILEKFRKHKATKITLCIVSKMDSCDLCSISLLQSKLAEALMISKDMVYIVVLVSKCKKVKITSVFYCCSSSCAHLLFPLLRCCRRHSHANYHQQANILERRLTFLRSCLRSSKAFYNLR